MGNEIDLSLQNLTEVLNKNKGKKLTIKIGDDRYGGVIKGTGYLRVYNETDAYWVLLDNFFDHSDSTQRETAVVKLRDVKYIAIDEMN